MLYTGRRIPPVSRSIRLPPFHTQTAPPLSLAYTSTPRTPSNPLRPEYLEVLSEPLVLYPSVVTVAVIAFCSPECNPANPFKPPSSATPALHPLQTDRPTIIYNNRIIIICL